MVAWRPRSLTQSTWVLDVTLGAIQPQHQSLASLFASLDTSASIALDQAQEANLSLNFSSKNTSFKPCAHSRVVGIQSCRTMYVLDIAIAFITLAAGVVALRLFTRLYFIRTPGWDDLLIVLSLV